MFQRLSVSSHLGQRLCGVEGSEEGEGDASHEHAPADQEQIDHVPRPHLEFGEYL